MQSIAMERLRGNSKHRALRRESTASFRGTLQRGLREGSTESEGRSMVREAAVRHSLTLQEHWMMVPGSKGERVRFILQKAPLTAVRGKIIGGSKNPGGNLHYGQSKERVNHLDLGGSD